MLFWLALVLGGGLALLSLFGDVLGLDSDSGGGVEIDHDGLHILSLRSATYGLFAFGSVGVLLEWAWGGRMTPVTLLAALATGGAAAVFSAYLFRWVKSTASGEMARDNTLIGLAAHVVLPIQGGSGKVLVARAGREHELLARPFDADAPAPESWTDVVVVDIVDGTALVSPLDDESRDALLPTPQES